jgi:hypothetical protein
MKNWKRVFKSSTDKMLLDGDGNGILNALIDERASSRRKAAEALRLNGLGALRGITAAALTQAIATAGIYLPDTISQHTARKTVLQFMFTRALVDPDEQVRESLVRALSVIDPVWVEQTLGNLTYDGAYVVFSFPTEAIGLLSIPPDPSLEFFTRSVARGRHSPEALYLGSRAHGFMRTFRSISSAGADHAASSPEFAHRASKPA